MKRLYTIGQETQNVSEVANEVNDLLYANRPCDAAIALVEGASEIHRKKMQREVDRVALELAGP